MNDLPTGTVTFLLTDIEGSTQLLQRVGDRYSDLLAAHSRLLRSAFESAGGKEVSTEGDSFFVVFPTAPQAVAAAIAAQRALRDHGWPNGERVRVRIGVHTGEGTLGGDNYVGLDLHRAARIAQAAHGGQVLLSEATRALVEEALPDGVALRDLGEHRLKDLARPVHLFQLVINGLPQDFPPVRSLDARPNNLPLQLTSFVGREREIEQVKRALAETRLLTLSGPGGTGKTRLALQVGGELLQEFEQGVFFIPLASIQDPNLVPSTIAHALGLVEEATRSVLPTLQDHLRDREVLLILDNFEQVTGAAVTVAELLRAAPKLKAMVTSRALLRVSGEREYLVPPLALPDFRRLPALESLSQYEAVALFVQRARAVRPDFSVTNENAPAVAEICVRLDGLPLAIELAAARAKVLTPPAILQRLGRRLALLTGGARDLPARQQTLRDAIGWSYDLLHDAERRLFRRLSVFVDGASLDAAERVCNRWLGLEVDSLDGLSSLVDKSLLRQAETDEGEPRFRMLHVIREYALERLEEADESPEIHRRHAGFFLELAELAAPELTGSDRARWLDRLEVEHGNFRGALDWTAQHGEVGTALRLAAALWRFWQMRGFLQEARQRLETLLALPESAGDEEVRARALEAAGGVAYWQNDFPAATRFYSESLKLSRRLGDRSAIAGALYNLAFPYFLSVPPQTEVALRSLEESLALNRELGNRLGEAKCLWALSDVTGEILGHLERGREYLMESLSILRGLTDRFSLGWALHGLGLNDLRTGRLDEARAHWSEGLALFAHARDLSGIVLLLDDLALLAEAEGREERALRLRGAAAALQAITGTELAQTVREWAGSRSNLEGLSEEQASLYAEGQAMSMEEAVAYALKEPE